MRKNDGAVRPQRVSRTRRSQQVLSSERRHRRVKKFAATAKEDGENAFVSGFHVRVKLDNGQRASRMISDAYCIRSDDDATTTITTTRRFFPPPPPSRRRCLLSPRLPHPTPLFPSSGSSFPLPCSPRDQFSLVVFPRSFSPFSSYSSRHSLPGTFSSFFRRCIIRELYNVVSECGELRAHSPDGERPDALSRCVRQGNVQTLRSTGRFRKARYL